MGIKQQFVIISKFVGINKEMKTVLHCLNCTDGNYKNLDFNHFYYSDKGGSIGGRGGGKAVKTSTHAKPWEKFSRPGHRTGQVGERCMG